MKKLLKIVIAVFLAGIINCAEVRKNPNQDLIEQAQLGASGDLAKPLSSGANVNHQDEYGNTALMYLARCDENKAAIELLINSGANPHISNRRGSTALIEAAKLGANENVKFLISANVYLDQQDILKNTALFYTVKFSKHETTMLLLKDGADFVNLKDAQNKCAMDYADELPDVRKIFLEFKDFIEKQVASDLVKFIDAVRDGQLKTAQDLIQKEAIDINELDHRGRNALIIALMHGQLQTVKLLVANGANPNIKLWGEDALMWAISNGKNFVSLILKSKIAPDFTAKNKSGENALEIAKREQNNKPEKYEEYQEIIGMIKGTIRKMLRKTAAASSRAARASTISDLNARSADRKSWQESREREKKTAKDSVKQTSTFSEDDFAH